MGRFGGACAALAAVVAASVVTTGTGAGAEPVPFGGAPDPVSIALDHLRSAGGGTGSFTAADADALRVTDVVPTEHNGVTNVYVQQQHNGIPIAGALANVAVTKVGDVANSPSSFVDSPSRAAAGSSATPSMTSVDAVAHAAAALGVAPTEPFEVVVAATGAEQTHTLSSGGIARGPIPAHLVYEVAAADSRSPELDLAWEFTIDLLDSVDVWVIRTDATTGAELSRYNLTHYDSFDAHAPDAVAAPVAPAAAHPGVDLVDTPGAGPIDVLPALDPAPPTVDDGSSYTVYASDVRTPDQSTPAAPLDGRVIVENPADAVASPFGWHDFDGAAGAESTLTAGNNAIAYLDADNDDTDDPSDMVDGGLGLDFHAPLDLSAEPSTYADASVVNLFHATNVMHDFLYVYGFDEEAGNFQHDNYGNGGAGGDPVLAEAHDGANGFGPFPGERNNAFFATYDDGNPGRMMMFLWDTTTPERDGSLMNEIIYHEYGHGLSTRLTGGPSTSTCLGNAEQPGEGWSDIVSLLATMQVGDLGTDGVTTGAYALGNAPGGSGVRAYPYSTDLAVNPLTYDSIKTATGEHAVGTVWATMLWDLTWLMIDEYGFSPDLAHGDGGNNRAMQLIVDGMKMQTCEPGFIDARNGILAADAASGGEDECLIWTAFARRGLGASAQQGSWLDVTDGVEAFDLPIECDISVTKSASAPVAETGSRLTYTVQVDNVRLAEQSNVIVLDTLPAGVEYLAGSASCAVSAVGQELTLDFGDMPADSAQSCSYDVDVTGAPSVATTEFDDGFEPDASSWIAEHGAGLPYDWALDSASPRSGANAMFADNVLADGISDQYLTTVLPVDVELGTELRFWHQYSFEHVATPGGIAYFDGGVVEVWVAGEGGWFDLGSTFVQGGYDGEIAGASGNPLGGRSGFGGNKPGYSETVADLSDFAGEQIYIRFRMGTDHSNEEPDIGGWSIDDVSIVDTGKYVNRALVVVDGFPKIHTQLSLPVVAATVTTAPLNPMATAHDGAATVTWDEPTSIAAGGALPTGYTVTATPGGATCTTTVLTCTVTGLTNATSHTFTVTAENPAGTSPSSAASNAVTPLAPPTVVVAPADGQTDSTSASTVRFAIEFEQPVTGFDDSDLSVGGTAGATTVALTGSGSSYEATVTGMTADGTVTLRVASGAAVNPNGDVSLESNEATVVYDTTAPTFTSAPTSTVSADTDPGKPTAVVEFDVAADDLQPGDESPSALGLTSASMSAASASGVAVTCTPASGSEFAIGTTPVACAATDAAGNVATASFDVEVSDREAPVISNPGDQSIVLPTGPSGAVSFTMPTSTDNSGAVTVACSPESGDVLSAGANSVTCTATDPSGNTSAASFVVTVTVATPTGQLPATGNSSLPIREALIVTLAGAVLLLAGHRRRGNARA